MHEVVWNSPDTTPEVDLGTEKIYWIAVYSEHTKKNHVFSAYYQNRPLITDEDGEFIEGCEDWALMSNCDGYVSSVGWMTDKAHYDYDDFYVPIVFDESYKLLGWAEYCTPTYP